MPPPVSQKQAKSAPVPKKATAKKPSWKWTPDSDEEVAPEQLPHTPAPDDMPVHQPAFNRNADLDALLARKRALDREKEAIAAAIASLPLRAPQEPPAPTLVHEVEVQEPPAPIASPVAEVPPRVSTTPKRRGSSAVSASPGPEDVDDIFICRCSGFNCLLREDLSTLDAYQWMKAHGFFKPVCPDGHSPLHIRNEAGAYVCWHPFEEGAKKKYCRRRCNVMNPAVNPVHLFRAVQGLASGPPWQQSAVTPRTRTASIATP